MNKNCCHSCPLALVDSEWNFKNNFNSNKTLGSYLKKFRNLERWANEKNPSLCSRIRQFNIFWKMNWILIGWNLRQKHLKRYSNYDSWSAEIVQREIHFPAIIGRVYHMLSDIFNKEENVHKSRCSTSHEDEHQFVVVRFGPIIRQFNLQARDWIIIAFHKY